MSTLAYRLSLVGAVLVGLGLTAFIADRQYRRDAAVVQQATAESPNTRLRLALDAAQQVRATMLEQEKELAQWKAHAAASEQMAEAMIASTQDTRQISAWQFARMLQVCGTPEPETVFIPRSVAR